MKLGIVGTGQIAEEVMPQLGGWGWTAQALCGTPRSEEKVRQPYFDRGQIERWDSFPI